MTFAIASEKPNLVSAVGQKSEDNGQLRPKHILGRATRELFLIMACMLPGYGLDTTLGK